MEPAPIWQGSSTLVADAVGKALTVMVVAAEVAVVGLAHTAFDVRVTEIALVFAKVVLVPSLLYHYQQKW